MRSSQIKWIGIGLVVLLLIGLSINRSRARRAAHAQTRDVSIQNTCRNNLRMLGQAVDQAALTLNCKSGDVLTEDQITGFLMGGFQSLVCPKGGRYAILPVGQEHTCSVHGTFSALSASRKPTQVAGQIPRADGTTREGDKPSAASPTDKAAPAPGRIALRQDGTFAYNRTGTVFRGTQQLLEDTLSLTVLKHTSSDCFHADHIVDTQNRTWHKSKPLRTKTFAYFVAAQSVYRLDVETGTTAPLRSGLPKTENLLFDDATDSLLLTTWHSESPILAIDPLMGGAPRTEYDGPGTGGQGFAYDEAASLLVFGLYYKGVFANNLQDEQGWRQLVSSSDLSPMIGQRGQLVTDPTRQQIYFRTAYNGDCNDCRYIWRVNYDGSGLEKVTRANGGDALAISVPSNVLIYSDRPGDGTIKSVSLDGSNVQTLMTLPESYKVCNKIVVDPDGTHMYLYVASSSREYSRRAIARADLDGSGFKVLTERGRTRDGWGLALGEAAVQEYALKAPSVEADSAASDGHAWVWLAVSVLCFSAAAFLLIPVVLIAARLVGKLRK